MSEKKQEAPAKGGKAPAAKEKQEKRKRVASEIDDLFAALPKRAEKPAEAEAAAADNRDDGGAGPSEEERAKRKKEKEYYLSNGERLAVQSAPRRYEDGLPVFKSFEDFSDLQADQQVLVKKKKSGKCPFDCWCCY